MIPKLLTKEMIKSYEAVCALQDWSDISLKKAGLGASDLWYALRVYSYIDDYCKRTGLKREDVAVIVNRNKDKAFCQWKYAAGSPIAAGTML